MSVSKKRPQPVDRAPPGNRTCQDWDDFPPPAVGYLLLTDEGRYGAVMDEASDAGTRAAQRGAAAQQRGQELRERRAELGEENPIGQLDVDRSAAAVKTAQKRADAAAVSVAVEQRKSARAHDEAAEVHQRAAVDGTGDGDAHRRAARRHTEAAAADRALADGQDYFDPS